MLRRTTLGELHAGAIAVIKGRPARIDEFRKTVPGKHGHAKAVLRATDLSTGAKLEETLSAAGDVWAVTSQPREETLLAAIDYSDGVLTFLSGDGSGGGQQRSAHCRQEIAQMLLSQAEEEEEGERSHHVALLLLDAAEVEGWAYESFTMGHDTGRGYNLAAGTRHEMTLVLDLVQM